MRWTLAGWLAAALVLGAADMYAVATLLPALVQDFDVPLEHLERSSPIVTGFLCGYVMALPLLAAYGSPRGRIRALIAALALFAAGSAATALSETLPALVAARVVQGFAGGAMVPVALSTVAFSFSGRDRLLALGLLGAAQELGSVAGPVAGALLAQAIPRLGWRAVFWFDVPLAVVCAAGLWLAAAGMDAERGAAAARSAPDWLGAALLAVALGALVVGLYPADPGRQAVGPHFLPALAVAAAAGIAFAAGVVRRGSGIVPPSLLRSRRALGALGVNLLAGGALAAALVDVPLLARTVFGLGAAGAAGQLARLMIAVAIAAVAGGWVAARIGPAVTATAGCLCAAAGMLSAAGFTGETLALRWGPFTAADPALVVAGLGFGLILAPAASIVLDAAPGEPASASSLVVVSRTVGMVAGLSALTAVGLHRFYQLLGPVPALNPSAPGFAQTLRAFEARGLAALTAEFAEIFRFSAVILLVAAVVAATTLPRRRAAGRAG